MNEQYIEKTISTLGTIVSKPKLVASLLRKPPFRYLHDILVEVLRVSATARGLFSAGELDHNQAGADKNSKIDFLNKLITFVSLCVPEDSGHLKEVNPAKIVAGLEPEKTNLLLQSLHKAATSHLNNSQAAVESFFKPTTTSSRLSRPQSAARKRPETTSVSSLPITPTPAVEESSKHGALVREILKSDPQKVPSETNRSATKKLGHFDDLREEIQKMTMIAAPLTEIIEKFPEDLAALERENEELEDVLYKLDSIKNEIIYQGQEKLTGLLKHLKLIEIEISDTNADIAVVKRQATEHQKHMLEQLVTFVESN